MSLSKKSIDRLDAAANFVTSMLCTMRFYFTRIERMIEAKELTQQHE